MLHCSLAPDQAAADLLSRYAARVGYSGVFAPTLDVLRALQTAHLAAIPFEAIDVLLAGAVDIGAEAVDTKLMGRRRRGGYCFEQNGLLLRVLHAAGFDAEPLLGRVRWMLPDDAPPTPRTHLVLRVKLEGQAWLVDAGFGAAVPPAPLALGSAQPQPTRHESYRVVRQPRSYRVESLVAGDWRPLYEIDDSPAPFIDLEAGNWYTATHPRSHFRSQLIAARTTDAARYGLRDNRMTIRTFDGKIDQSHLTASQIERALTDIFLIDVDPAWHGLIERAAAATAVPRPREATGT